MAATVGVPPRIERAGIVLVTVAVAVSANGGVAAVIIAVLVALGTILAGDDVLGVGAGVRVSVVSVRLVTGAGTDRSAEIGPPGTAKFGEIDTNHSWPRVASVAVIMNAPDAGITAVNEKVPVDDVDADPGLTDSKVTVLFGGQSAPSTTTGHDDW